MITTDTNNFHLVDTQYDAHNLFSDNLRNLLKKKELESAKALIASSTLPQSDMIELAKGYPSIFPLFLDALEEVYPDIDLPSELYSLKFTLEKASVLDRLNEPYTDLAAHVHAISSTLPESVSVRTVIDFILTRSATQDIPRAIDAALASHPDFELPKHIKYRKETIEQQLFEERFSSVLYSEDKVAITAMIRSAPPHIKPEKIAALLFDHAPTYKLLLFLDSFFSVHPTTTLSPRQLERQISTEQEIFLHHILCKEYDLLQEMISHHIFKVISPQAMADIAVKYELPTLLDTIFVAYPTFSPSTDLLLRKAILEETQKPTLTNATFTRLLEEHAIPQEARKPYYDFAYQKNVPHLYIPSSTPVKTDDYTLNFLWTNLNPQDRKQDTAEHIFGEGSTEPSPLTKIETWVEHHPGATVNLWYDSALVTEKARRQTWTKLEEIATRTGAKLHLRDIRQLSCLPSNIQHALHPGTPLYFRIDLLKVLIIDHMMSSPTEKARYCIVSDVDIEAMPTEQIFHERTMEYLSQYGYVFNRVGNIAMENSFLLFDKNKTHLQQLHHTTMIDELASILASSQPIGSQRVFNQYGKFANAIGDPKNGSGPRIVVRCPPSQFNCPYFSPDDHRSETFCFKGGENIPYTANGRASDANEMQLFPDWIAEPL